MKLDKRKGWLDHHLAASFSSKDYDEVSDTILNKTEPTDIEY